MTDAEKLAIAEEIATSQPDIRLHDITITHYADTSGTWFQAWRKNCVLITRFEDVFKCIHDARQKLAAEREAAKSPRERRIEKALADVTDYAARWFFSPRGTELLVAAREALKE